MTALTQVPTEHRDRRMLEHVDELPRLADQIGPASWPEFAPRLLEAHAFLVETLLPHMEALEEGVHPELDWLLSSRLAMAPMGREHEAVRRLVARLGELVATPALSDGEAVELNRVLLRLYSILKVHLREESLYIPILERSLAPEQVDALVASLGHAARAEL